MTQGKTPGKTKNEPPRPPRDILGGDDRPGSNDPDPGRPGSVSSDDDDRGNSDDQDDDRAHS